MIYTLESELKNEPLFDPKGTQLNNQPIADRRRFWDVQFRHDGAVEEAFEPVAYRLDQAKSLLSDQQPLGGGGWDWPHFTSIELEAE